MRTVSIAILMIAGPVSGPASGAVGENFTFQRIKSCCFGANHKSVSLFVDLFYKLAGVV